MKRIAAVTAGIMLGMGMAAPLADMPQASAKEKNVIQVNEDNDIFKVAELPENNLTEAYRLAKYDVIDIRILGFNTNQENTGLESVTIGPDGCVQLPYAGTVQLAGLTLDQAREVLTRKLGTYVKIPDLSIGIKEFSPRKVYVMGNVKDPGEKKIQADSMFVHVAISMAGGIDNRGRSKHVQVIRPIRDTLYYKEVNLDAYLKKHDMNQNIILQDGDIVYVPDSGKVVFSEDIMPYINVYATYRALTKN